VRVEKDGLVDDAFNDQFNDAYDYLIAEQSKLASHWLGKEEV
jgi:hypothetical protein